MARAMTTADFIIKAKEVHGGKYDYSETTYNGQSVKVIIICPIHGKFFQHPANHYLKKCECPKCGALTSANKQRKTKEHFIEEANKVHSNFYTYGNVVYLTARKPVVITCPEHGDFNQLPTNHLKGVGCPSCYGGLYNPKTPAILYYLSINDGNVYKIGITSRDVNTRFSPSEIKKIEVINVWTYPTGKEAYETEQALLKLFSDYKYKGDKILQSGNTELFSVDVFSLYGLSHTATITDIIEVLE